MVKRVIKINTFEDVKNFNRITSNQLFDADLVKGRWVIDAKSLLGIYSLDFSQPLDLVIHATEDEAKDYIAALGAMIIG